MQPAATIQSRPRCMRGAWSCSRGPALLAALASAAILGLMRGSASLFLFPESKRLFFTAVYPGVQSTASGLPANRTVDFSSAALSSPIPSVINVSSTPAALPVTAVVANASIAALGLGLNHSSSDSHASLCSSSPLPSSSPPLPGATTSPSPSPSSDFSPDDSGLFSFLRQALVPRAAAPTAAPVASASTWDTLWHPRGGHVSLEFAHVVGNVTGAAAPKQDWDRAWMLVLQAVMRRRFSDWFADPRVHGGIFVRGAAQLLQRLSIARSAIRNCSRDDTTVVAAVMIKGEGRFIQEWLTWHIFVGFSHFVVYYEAADDGTLDALAPFVDAGLVTAIPTDRVPGIAESLEAKQSQVMRQRVVYDHSLLTLQTVACRYRGRGSPFSVQPCSSEELSEYYAPTSTKGGEAAGLAGDFQNPHLRPRHPNGSFVTGPKYLLRQFWWMGKYGKPADPAVAPRVNAASRHVLWLAPLDSDEFVVAPSGECFVDILYDLRHTHASLGLPWQQFQPNGISLPQGALTLQSITLRRPRPSSSMLKHVTNVQYADSVDIHFPFLRAPHSLREENGHIIDYSERNDRGNLVHTWVGPPEKRRVWLQHRVSRSLEAAAFKGVRQAVDDAGAGNARSSESMLSVISGTDALAPGKPAAIRDADAWLQGREFILTVFFGPRAAATRFGGGAARAWRELWEPQSGPASPEYHKVISDIMSVVAPRQEWDKGWMLLLTAVMRRRSKDWFFDPSLHGGLFIPDANTLRSRLHSAEAAHSCVSLTTTVVAVVMVRGEGRYLQEWIAWHLFSGYRHVLAYLDDVDDGSGVALKPFVEAGLVTAFITSEIPGVAASLRDKENHVFRQQAVYDHAMLLLQKVACRYRGVGSPAAQKPCTQQELWAHYSGGPFASPYDRALDSKSSKLVGASWLGKLFRAAERQAKSKVVRPRRTPARVPRSVHDIWLAVADSDEFMVATDGRHCVSEVLESLRDTHAALGVPWRDFFPNGVLEPHGSLLLWNLTRTRRLQQGSVPTRRGDIQGTKSMPKQITNVRFALGVDVHFPILLEPYAYLDEYGAFIDMQAKNDIGVQVHDFGPHERRRLFNHHFIGRSMEALAWKGVRQYLDDKGGGNVRSTRSMLGTVTGMNAFDANVTSHLGVVRDGSAWEWGREFMLTMLFGLQNRSLGGSVAY